MRRVFLDGNKLFTILLTKTTAAQYEPGLSYRRVRGLYFLVVIFVATTWRTQLRRSFHMTDVNRLFSM